VTSKLGITSFLEPKTFILLIPLLLILAFILFRNFVSEDIGNRRERFRFRIIILLIRSAIIILLVIALAKPYGETTITTPGDPKITILVDNSSSMGVLDMSFLPQLKSDLEKEFPVTIRPIGSGTTSDLGDEVLGYLEKDNNLLLVTDGQDTTGASLEKVSIYAANLNSTLSAISLKNKEPEVGVSISGPDTTVNGVNNTYTINIVNLDNQDVQISVMIDNEQVLNQATKENSISIQKTFDEGDHLIVAKAVGANDHFIQNNEFYKVVSVVKKPKILLVQNTADPAEQLFGELYDVTKLDYIPDNVNDYYAVVINDMPANIKGVNKLADYIIDQKGGYYGNGVLVIGGFDSFDRGDYKGSVLESFLPVTVGKAARKRGSSNIAISIDFSGTTGARFYCPKPKDIGCGKGDWVQDTSNIQDVNKALAASIIKSLGPDNTVGVSIFTSQSATISELNPLFKVKDDLIDKISRIQQPPGQSMFNIGLSGAYLLLKDHVGSNNIIMITDGQTDNDEIKKATIDAAKTLNSRGVKVYVVGTGKNVDESFLKDVAYNGAGIYFPADQSNNLKILFGEPEDSKFGEQFDLFIINQYHFITQGLLLDASLYGYNQVVPRANAIQLVTTQNGDPALTVWNYGLGRVAALNVFSGNNNLGDLLNKRNSILLTRATNWVIGDPQRKDSYYVAVSNARVNSSADVIVKSEKYPNAEGLTLSKIGEDQYKTSVKPTETGFRQIMGKQYAVNYEQEYQALGMKENLEATTAMSGGQMFTPSQKDEIVKFVKSVSKKTRTERTTIIWPFLLSAAILFIGEVFLRRVREYNTNK
jgi:hypothetical protein